MATYTLGQNYLFYFDQADISSAMVWPSPHVPVGMNLVGEIPGDVTLNRGRTVVDRRTRDAAFDVVRHAGDRTGSLSFTMNLDIDDNAGYADLQACFDSDSDTAAGAAGSGATWALHKATDGTLAWRGTCVVTDLSLSLARDGLCSCSVTLECGELEDVNYNV